MPACTICTHPQSYEIDRALLSSSETANSIARRYGLDDSSISRHRANHLLPKLALREDALPDVDPLEEMQRLYARLGACLDAAEASQNWQAMKAMFSEARQYLELLAKLHGQIRDYTSMTQVNVMTDPNVKQLYDTIAEALEPYPEAGYAVAAALKDYDEQQGA